MPAWSGLWNGVHGDGHTLLAHSNPGKRLSRALRGMTARKYKEILRTLVTDDVGTTAAASHSRLLHSTDSRELGGVRSVETVTDVNRAVTAADETAIVADIDGDHTPTFPTEKSGNSGGGKLGF